MHSGSTSICLGRCWARHQRHQRQASSSSSLEYACSATQLDPQTTISSSSIPVLDSNHNPVCSEAETHTRSPVTGVWRSETPRGTSQIKPTSFKGVLFLALLPALQGWRGRAPLREHVCCSSVLWKNATMSPRYSAWDEAMTHTHTHTQYLWEPPGTDASFVWAHYSFMEALGDRKGSLTLLTHFPPRRGRGSMRRHRLRSALIKLRGDADWWLVFSLRFWMPAKKGFIGRHMGLFLLRGKILFAFAPRCHWRSNMTGKVSLWMQTYWHSAIADVGWISRRAEASCQTRRGSRQNTSQYLFWFLTSKVTSF